ncbi:MAG: CRISPR-associated endonuclease Cas1 [candidate division WOR-3 bacterium]
MATLYLTEQGSKITKTSERLIVEKDNQVLLQVPIIKIERILIFGRVKITLPVFELLLNQGIPTAFLSINGRLKGLLEPTCSKNVVLRIRQYERTKDPNFKLRFARSIVRGKIQNQKRLVQRFAGHHSEINFKNYLTELNWLEDAINRKTSISGIIGIEGQATAVYFSAYGKLFQDEIQFIRRTRRPPKDPINSLLSLGYTILGNEYLSLLSAVGFDPYLSFYHTISYGRPSLALDLVEELRHPVIDMLVLDLIGRRILKAKDFNEIQDGFYLTQKGRKEFFTHYERRMTQEFIHPQENTVTNMRMVMRSQVHKLMATVQSGKDYEPYFIG